MIYKVRLIRQAMVSDQCELTVEADSEEQAGEKAEALYDEQNGDFEWEEVSYSDTEVWAEEVLPCTPN